MNLSDEYNMINIGIFADRVIYREIINSSRISVLQFDVNAVSRWCYLWLNANERKYVRV